MNDHNIIQLDKDISNKIAAGEVVERPLAVVKELVENAIDAGARKITVEIKDAGKSLIRITDNGSGIQPNDIVLAFERHSTSKIRTINDIYHISSLGFRGEALASIASVSNVEIISKHKDYDMGKKLVLEGGHIVLDTEIGAPQGTTIFVKDLFFNTPARLKFLKSNNAEQNAINDIMNKLALSHPEIAFKYIVGGHNIFMSPGNGKLYDVILNIYQRQLAKSLIEIKNQDNGIAIEGYISNIEMTRGNRQYQVIFVNNRYVKSKSIEDAVALAYRTLIPHNRFPIVFLNITIDPSLIDINIHPAKTEIRFHQEGLVKDLVYKSLTLELNRYNLIPSKPLNSKPVANSEVLKEYVKNPIVSETPEYNPKPSASLSPQPKVTLTNVMKKPIFSQNRPSLKDIEVQREKTKILNESLSKLNTFTEEKKEKTIDKPISRPLIRESMFVEEVYEPAKPLFEIPESTIYDDLKFVGQIFNTYLIFEKSNEMYLMDQHAAHEKVLYERYVEDFKNKKMTSQMILEPITINVNYMEQNKLMQHLDKIIDLGFSIEPFGDNTVIIREIPQLFNLSTAKKMIESLIEKMDFKLPEERFELSLEMLMQQSCKAAIKANDRLDTIEVSALISQLKTLKDPYTCPHGRPIIISISKNELEKKFNRI